MKTYSEREVFTRTEMALLRDATAIVAALPDVDQRGRELRCHEVARVVAEILGLRAVDGRYETGAQHSWCKIPGSLHILDPYAVGRLPAVQLVAHVPLLPCRYVVRERDQDPRLDVVDWLVAIALEAR